MSDLLPPAPPLPAPIPAATLVILRDVVDGDPELLMVERARAMAFAGGALVFPGGRIDPGDHALAATIGAAPAGVFEDGCDDTAARIAAIRETIEEAGIAIGLVPQPGPEALARMRAALGAGQTLGEVLAAENTVLDLAQLVPFARWRPAHANMRIFDTRFYLARLPADAPPATVDRTENVRLLWASATAVLAEADAGRATVIYPTRRNLERLARFRGFAEAVADAARYPVRVITPVVEDRDGVPHLCIPEELGYPVTAEAMSRTRRG